MIDLRFRQAWLSFSFSPHHILAYIYEVIALILSSEVIALISIKHFFVSLQINQYLYKKI